MFIRLQNFQLIIPLLHSTHAYESQMRFPFIAFSTMLILAWILPRKWGLKNNFFINIVKEKIFRVFRSIEQHQKCSSGIFHAVLIVSFAMFCTHFVVFSIRLFCFTNYLICCNLECKRTKNVLRKTTESSFFVFLWFHFYFFIPSSASHSTSHGVSRFPYAQTLNTF